MKPRIFVSSTFYDLKYIREDLSNFIKAHDFEPILFEDGDIGYTPGKPLDKSCYDTMRSSDMVILVIGGLYGSPATDEEQSPFQEYMSVTRNEFRTAVNEGIPVFVFIDTKVYSEYAVYELNMKAIEERNSMIKFSATKDINIFRFIREIKNIGNISITEFSKLTQIKDFLSKQWSDMFKKYLEILKEDRSNHEIKSAVSEMNVLVQKMNLMLDSVGKKILDADDSGEYESVLNKQNIIEASEKIVRGFDLCEISWIDSEEERKNVVTKLLDALKASTKTDLWNKALSFKSEDVKALFNYFKDAGIKLSSISISMAKDVKDLKKILDDPKMKELLIDKLITDEFYDEMISHEEKEEQ